MDKRLIQGRTQEWNISEGELQVRRPARLSRVPARPWCTPPQLARPPSHARSPQALADVGLLTRAELASCVVSRFNPVRVGFAGGEDMWVNDCLNLGVSPRKLLDIIKAKVRLRRQHWGALHARDHPAAPRALTVPAPERASARASPQPCSADVRVLNVRVALMYRVGAQFVEAGGVLMENHSFRSAEVVEGSGVKLTLVVHPAGVAGAQLGPGDVNRPNGLGGNSSNLAPPFTPVTQERADTPGPARQTPRRMTLNTRLLLDCMGHYSDIVKQMRGRAKPDGMCLVVGSCAEGARRRRWRRTLLRSARVAHETGAHHSNACRLPHQQQHVWRPALHH